MKQGSAMHQQQLLRAFPLYGFHWRMKDEWVSADLDATPVQPVMQAIWRDYFLPAHPNVVRFHIDIMAYWAKPANEQQTEANAMVINRLINLCRYARASDVRLISIFAGSHRYRPGKERQFPVNVAAFVQDFLRQLQRLGETELYEQIAIWQVEDEMNHPIRHAGWAQGVYTAMLLTACENIRVVEQRETSPCHAPRMVIFPADLMFFKDFVLRPWHYVPAMLRYRFYDFTPPGDLKAFVNSEAVDIIGVDLYPGLYSPLATTETFLKLVRHLCQTYGLGTCYNKHILVAEAGYPTLPNGYGRERNQLRFYQKMMTGLSDYHWRGGGREQGFLGLIWYCFNDQKIRLILWPPQEWRFGAVKTVPPNEWYATYPSEPKLVWYWLRDNVVPFSEKEEVVAKEGDDYPGSPWRRTPEHGSGYLGSVVRT